MLKYYFQRAPAGEILRVQARLWMVGVTIRWFMSAGMMRKPIAGHTFVSHNIFMYLLQVGWQEVAK